MVTPLPLSVVSRRLVLIFALAPLLAGWDGSAIGTVTVKDTGAMAVGSAQVDGGVSVGARVHAVLNLHQPGGYGGVLDLEFPEEYIDAVVDLPHHPVSIRYTVYDSDGDEVFFGRVPRRGQLVVESTPEGLILLLDAEILSSRTVGDSVSLLDLTARVAEVSAPPPPPPAPVVRRSTYYEDDYYVEPDVYVEVHHGHSSGCDADDWEDDGWADDSSDYDSGGGCEGDDLDTGSTSGGGCEGDDIGGGSGASMDGCEGDALANNGQRARKSPTVVRLLNFAPWFFAFLAIRLLRRRPF